MHMAHIKKDYSAEIEQFLANGGEVKQAVNSNQVEFNPKRNLQNVQPRKEAERKGLTTYVPFEPCEKCGTSERSVKTNACIACDRRRARARTGLTSERLQGIGHYLLEKNEQIEFTSNGKKYVLKVEEI